MAEIIDKALISHKDDAALEALRLTTRKLCERFPIYR